jgi:hypothetical protein
VHPASPLYTCASTTNSVGDGFTTGDAIVTTVEPELLSPLETLLLLNLESLLKLNLLSPGGGCWIPDMLVEPSSPQSDERRERQRESMNSIPYEMDKLITFKRAIDRYGIE